MTFEKKDFPMMMAYEGSLFRPVELSEIRPLVYEGFVGGAYVCWNLNLYKRPAVYVNRKKVTDQKQIDLVALLIRDYLERCLAVV